MRRSSAEAVWTVLAVSVVGCAARQKSATVDADSGRSTDSGSRLDLDAVEAELWQAWLAEAPDDWKTSTEANVRHEQTVTSEAATMRYTVERLGDATGAVPLYIALHGGGGAPAEVNDDQWEAMQRYYRSSVSEGIYVAPRGITNEWNLHFDEASYLLYDRLIERMVVQEGVDPDRVYLLGFSAGGDGVYQVVPRMADRFAAANMSAGHPNGMPATNLANVPFLVQMGELDTAYDRHLEAVRYTQQLDDRADAHAGMYTHTLFLHKDGHHNAPWSDRAADGSLFPVIVDYDAWIEDGNRDSTELDTNAVKWLDPRTRAPYPGRVVWEPEHSAERDGRQLSLYWLAVDASTAGLLDVSHDAQDNSITVHTDEQGDFRVRLNHHMLDLHAPITVRTPAGEQELEVVPDPALMQATLAERGDPGHIFSVELRIEGGVATVVSGAR